MALKSPHPEEPPSGVSKDGGAPSGQGPPRINAGSIFRSRSTMNSTALSDGLDRGECPPAHPFQCQKALSAVAVACGLTRGFKASLSITSTGPWNKLAT